jgi:hypothetical protein
MTAGVNASGVPQSRLSAQDALAICLAMVAGDASLRRAAIAMWKALAPFIAGLTELQHELALEALDACLENTDLRLAPDPTPQPRPSSSLPPHGDHAARSDGSGVS